MRVLTGRLPPGTPRSKRLLADDRSNILIYLTGSWEPNYWNPFESIVGFHTTLRKFVNDKSVNMPLKRGSNSKVLCWKVVYSLVL